MNKSEGQVLDFEKICRLCLLEKRSMSSIFAKKKSDKKVPLPVRIMSCASLELYEGDGLPASICSKCLLSVNQSYAFREQCEQADTTLRQYAQRMNEASGETSTNRESRELIAKDSLECVEDIGINVEEGRIDEDTDFKRGGDLDLNENGSWQTNTEGFRCREKDEKVSEIGNENPFGDTELNLSKDDEQKLKKRESSSKKGKAKKKMKLKNNEKFKLSDPVVKGLSVEKVENVVVIADVAPVGKYEDYDIDVSGSEEDESFIFQRCLLKRKPQANINFENKKHLQLLQNLMNNKNIIIKKKGSSIPTDFYSGKILQLNNSFRQKKGLAYPDDFKVAQLWKEWEEINKRIPIVSEMETGRKDVGFGRKKNEDPPKETQESDGNPRIKWKNAKDTIYCKDCGIFLQRSSYNNHIKFVHKKIRKYLCQTCGYAACTGTILRQHVQAVHVGYSFFCDLCPKKFNLMKRLRKHVELQHSGKPVERNQICQYCGMAFVKSGCLKRHLRSHTQETPYECQYCQRRFKYRWPKVQHERLHTGEKPYKCSFCEERFTQNCVRKVHEYKKHGNEEFKPKTRTGEEKSFSKIKEDMEGSPESSGVESS